MLRSKQLGPGVLRTLESERRGSGANSTRPRPHDKPGLRRLPPQPPVAQIAPAWVPLHPTTRAPPGRGPALGEVATHRRGGTGQSARSLLFLGLLGLVWLGQRLVCQSLQARSVILDDFEFLFAALEQPQPYDARHRANDDDPQVNHVFCRFLSGPGLGAEPGGAATATLGDWARLPNHSSPGPILLQARRRAPVDQNPGEPSAVRISPGTSRSSRRPRCR